MVWLATQPFWDDLISHTAKTRGVLHYRLHFPLHKEKKGRVLPSTDMVLAASSAAQGGDTGMHACMHMLAAIAVH